MSITADTEKPWPTERNVLSSSVAATTRYQPPARSKLDIVIEELEEHLTSGRPMLSHDKSLMCRASRLLREYRSER